MFYVKFILMLVALGTSLTLCWSLGWHIMDSLNASYFYTAEGKVVSVIPPEPEDADRVPSNGGFVVVEYKDPAGQTKTDQYAQFNSGGATQFARRQPGETFKFELQYDHAVPNSERMFQWRNIGFVCLIMGGLIAAIGLVLRLGPSL